MRACRVFPILAVALAGPAVVHSGGDFDRRSSHNEEFEAQPNPAQVEAVEQLRQQAPDLMITYNRSTGATRTLTRPIGYLAESGDGSHEERTHRFLSTNHDLLGLTLNDVGQYEIKSSVPSKHAGTTHLHVQQMHLGLPVHEGHFQINYGRDGKIMSISNGFIPNLAAAVATTTPGINAATAVLRAMEHLGTVLPGPPTVAEPPIGVRQITTIEPAGISRKPIEAGLMWLPIRRGDTRLAWNFVIHTTDDRHVYDFNVDAVSGDVWTVVDRAHDVVDYKYTVYQIPAVSPTEIVQVPPYPPFPSSDQRGDPVTNPADAIASPNGWQATAAMTGPNVHARKHPSLQTVSCPIDPEDPNNEDFLCEFDIFPKPHPQHPSEYVDASVTNLFYWTNLVHDIQYQYGFDEDSGNFQTHATDPTKDDFVIATAQTPITSIGLFVETPDGTSPELKTGFFYEDLCPLVEPSCTEHENLEAGDVRDAALDAGIIVHEYGHGILSRLVGGPANLCVGTYFASPHEALPDWWALAYTDQGERTRSFGTYLLGQTPDGPGFRRVLYSTVPGVNTDTYETVNELHFNPRTVLAQALWEVYWEFIDEYGHDADLYNATGGAGNQRMMLYVNEGLKNVGCPNPDFLDIRDGIVQAAFEIGGAMDQCIAWNAFADFGMGVDATHGSKQNPVVNGFVSPFPGSCECCCFDDPPCICQSPECDP